MPSYNSRIENLSVFAGEVLHFRVGGWGPNDFGSGDLLLELEVDVIQPSLGPQNPDPEMNVEAELSGACDALLFSTADSELLGNGPFTAGEVVTAMLPTTASPGFIDFCVTPILSGQNGHTDCGTAAVLGPISAEACNTSLSPIPDAGEPVEIPLIVTGDPTLTVWDLHLELQTSHPDASQLIVELSAPDGTTELLHNMPPNASSSGLDLIWWMVARHGQIFDDGVMVTFRWQPLCLAAPRTGLDTENLR